MTMKRLSFFFFFLSVVLSVVSQPVCQIKYFSVSNGLAQGNVMSILQDQKGLMWFSTWNGINKFDGYTFKNYKIFQETTYSFESNRIGNIVESKYGDIWCTTYDGQACLFDVKTEKFIDVLQPLTRSLNHSNHVIRILSLKKGIAWILCKDGYTYRADEQQCKDGKGISPYSIFNGNLKGNQVYTVFQDSEEDEWVLTDKGITIVGKKTLDTDFPFRHIIQWKENIYLAAEHGKLAGYDFKTRQLKFIDVPYPYRNIANLTIIGKDTLALATDNGLILYTPGNNKFRQINIQTPTQHSNYVESVYQDRHGDIWVFSNTPGIIRLNMAANEKEHLVTPRDELVKHERKSRKIIFEDNTNTLWMLPTEGNFSYYDRKEKKLKPLVIDINHPKSIFSPLVRVHTIDNQGNAWMASARGVYKLSFSPQSFHFNQTDHEAETRAFLRDSGGRLWSASKSNHVRIYAPDGNLEGYLSKQGDIIKEQAHFFEDIYDFMEDQEHNIWMGSKGSGLYLLKKQDTGKYSVHHYQYNPEEPYSISGNDVYTIFQDTRKRIWVGCFGGGLNLIKQTGNGEIQFINCNNELKNYPTTYGTKIRNIAGGPEGVIFVGTTSGLITFASDFKRPEEIKFYRNNHRTGDTHSLNANDIMQIYTDRHNTTYVMSFTGGVNKIISGPLLGEDIQFKGYDKKDGLASDLMLSMIEDNSGQLWFVSEIALSKFNPDKETFENYQLNSTYQDFNFSEALPVINARHQIVLGTDKGFLEVMPDKMKKSSYVPPIIFTSLRIQGHPVEQSIDNLAELELKTSQRNVTFQFAALDYVAPEHIQYAYRLEGLEKEWNEAGNNRSASYINLPAGEYRLQVKSTNSDGVWTDNIYSLPVRVLPTFWETYWAWVFYSILFILFTATIVYVLFYIYRLRHRVDMEKQLTDIKLRFFTDISHELRTPLTLISSPVAEVLENEPLSPTAREYLTVVHQNTEHMLHLMNQILDFRKIQNQKMKLLVEKKDLISLLRKSMDNFKLIAKEKNMDYRLVTPVQSVYGWVDKDKFEKIFFNLLSNAFKYTPPGKAITIKVIPKEESVDIEVKDEGIGIVPDKQRVLFQRFESLVKQNILQPSSGIGLSLAKEMVEMHHGSIQVSSQPGVGSTFTVTLPLQQKVFEEDMQAEFILDDDKQETVSAANGLDGENAYMEETEMTDSDCNSILVVEDNNELRHFLKSSLSGSYNVITASNGKEGLQRAIDNVPDLIISDVMMPIMDGLEMIGQIKANHNICHIPIIVLSAKASLDDRIAGLEHGIDDYITKPFSSTYLKIRITSLLRQRKELQEMYMAKLTAGKDVALADDIPEPSQPQITPHDKLFMEKVMEFMEEQMDNPDLTIEQFAEKLLLSRTIFYQKLKSIVGLSPVNFICQIRIKRAVQLFDSGEYNISQIAYMTGFNDPKYFSRCFKKIVGVPPSEYKEKKQP